MKTNTVSTAGKHSHNIIAKGLHYSLNVVAKPHRHSYIVQTMNTGRPVFSAKVHGHGSGAILMYDTTRYICRPPLGNASTLPGCLFQERRIHEMSCLD